jgi:hypothetical protein
MRYLRPTLSDKEIPHHKKMCTEILERAMLAEERIRSQLSKIAGQVSFTFDSWTSQNGDPFLSVTGHYIAAPDNQPEEWELKTEQLAFAPIEGNHSSENLANIIVRVIDRYNLRSKVSHGSFFLGII